MPRHKIPSTGLVALLSCAMLAACSGGGGAGTSASPGVATATKPPVVVDTFCCSSLGPASMGSAYRTGLQAGPIAAFPTASFGTAQTQTATPQEPTFDGASGTYPANVTFPVISTSLQATGSSGLTAGPADSGAILKLITASKTSHSYELVIPSMNVDFSFSDGEGLVSNYDGYTRGFSYVAAGLWSDDAEGIRPLQHSAGFLFGYETPASAMPATGNASFVGDTLAKAYKSVGSNILNTYLFGAAHMSVNFSSGQVTGALTQIRQSDGQQYPNNGYLPWNDVSLTAAIATGTSRFSGTAAATSAPGTAFSVAGSATGHVDGALYGPATQNLGAIWSLSDGTVSAIGIVTAKQ